MSLPPPSMRTDCGVQWASFMGKVSHAGCPATVNRPYDGYLITTVVALVVGSVAWVMIIDRGGDRQ